MNRAWVIVFNWETDSGSESNPVMASNDEERAKFALKQLSLELDKTPSLGNDYYSIHEVTLV